MAYGDSAAESLAAVRTAIQRVLSGQEYRIGGRMVRYADLSELREMERELEQLAAEESGAVPILSVIQIDEPGAAI